MNTQTKTLLGLAAVAGVGYLVYKNMQDKKTAETANFANFVSDKTEMVRDRQGNLGPCQGDYGKDSNGLFICCRPKFRSATTLSKSCTELI